MDQWGIEKFLSLFNRIFEEKRNLPENRAVPLPTSGPAQDGPSTLNRLGAVLTAPFTRWLWPSRSRVGVMPQRQAGYSRVSVAVPLEKIRAKQLSTLSRLSRRYGNGRVQLTAEQDVMKQRGRESCIGMGMLSYAWLTIKGSRPLLSFDFQGAASVG